VDDYADDFFFDQSYDRLMGTSRDGKKGIVAHMDVGRRIAALDLPGMPHLGSGVNFTYQGRPMMATPHIMGAAEYFPKPAKNNPPYYH
jgi:hypothetical protein